MLAPTYRPRAAYDIESAVIYIGVILDSPQAARTWYETLVAKVDLLCEFPDLGRRFDDERLSTSGMQTYLVGSYRLFYSYGEDGLTVWRVVHASQDIDDYALVDLAD
ncbi:type II toxin-antitoxin system RelE/ParE family toxin [Raoultibacter phocaeensis]|uniref:type II toxin-antitoxin system RelE/ParE family toxin n=1 Tax=Raoultibacter phocaeensis TaxID=2479841 RepID=UPI0015D5F9D7|nr:type II toxin-antitoxin system RelE/ParE family toxin [Raoultibacter phocaeensis]